jgi:hypothetical protein
MEVSFLTTTLAGVFITWSGLVASVVMFLRVPGMKRAIQIPGMPRIWFLSLISLKLWVATFLGYISVGTIVGGLPIATRRYINLVLALLAALQALGVCVAVWRDQRKGATARIPGRRPPRREGGIEDDD